MSGKVQISGKISDEHKSLPVKKIIIAVVAISIVATIAYLFLQIPQAKIESIQPNLATEGDPVLFIGKGTTDKPGGSIVAYEWSLNNSILSDKATFSTQDLPVGTHNIQFKVKDNYGKWSKSNISEVKVLLNHPPTAYIDSILPGTIGFKRTLINFSGHGEDSDPNDSIVAYEWSINNSILSEKELFNVQNLSIGMHIVQFRVKDKHGNWSEPVTTNITINPYSMYFVFKEKGLIVRNGLCDNGSKNCIKQGNTFGGGYYGKIGERIALNSNPGKLVNLIIEQSASDKKILAVGEKWDVGGGWTLMANSIDAKATPKLVWLTLSYDGTRVDDYMLSQGEVYTYFEKSLAGENDVPLFVTYINSIYAGDITDMVELRFTWAISKKLTIY